MDSIKSPVGSDSSRRGCRCPLLQQSPSRSLPGARPRNGKYTRSYSPSGSKDADTLYRERQKSERQNCGIDDADNASFPYETSKACEDLLVESYRITYKLPITLLRFPNFFGKGDKHYERLVPSICVAAVKETELVIRTATRQYFILVTRPTSSNKP